MVEVLRKVPKVNKTSLLAKVLGHAAHVLLTLFVPDAAVHYAELVAEAAAALVGAEAVVVDGELHNWRGVDDAAVALAEAATSCCKGLLADRDSVFGWGGSGPWLDGLFVALGAVGTEQIRDAHGFGFLSWGRAGLRAGRALGTLPRHGAGSRSARVARFSSRREVFGFTFQATGLPRGSSSSS